ncbi:efflux RND transporter periplasmic adaptor subunit [Rhodovarius sp.]|uniref:efflux RND transporter periplasmic adaptor subunit n=1 Tax=Rhodovarius sp. TaxID=2972673 RepID=UPI0034A599BC
MNTIESPNKPDASRASPAPEVRADDAAAVSDTATGKPWLWIGLLVLGVGAAAGGFMVLKGPQQEAPRVAVAPAAPALPAGEFRINDNEMRALRIEPVIARDFRAERVAEGRISINEDRSTPVLAPFTGRVTRTFAQLGERVAQGAPLFEVETQDVTQAANDLLAALDGVTKAQNTLAQARREDARQQNLLAARASSQRDVEQARAALNSATSDVSIAQASLDSARDKLRVLGRDAAAIAEIERSRQVSGVVMVRAPFAGTVTQRRVSPGMWLTAGQGDPAVTISDLSTMWLVAAVRELDVPLIRLGQEVQVALGALPERSFTARIVRMGAGLDPATRRMMVQAEIQDPDGVLRAEMFATFRISVGTETRNAAVPALAVIHRGADASVWVALEGNRFAMRSIRIGNRSGDTLEVLQGLRPGERIVTGGALFIDRAARID